MKGLFRKDILKIKAYESGRPIEEVKRQLGLRDVIKLASNENPLGASPKAIRALIKALDCVNRYPDGSCFYLKKALAKKLRLKPSNIILGNGSDEIIDIIVKTFVENGQEIITSQTAFLEYEIIAKANARKVIIIPLKDFAYDLRAIRRRINSLTKLIFIANPNNPTGTYLDKTQIGIFLKDLPKGVVVVFDEAYREFVDKKDYPDTLKLIDKYNIVILRTFSKAYGLAGLRIGYGIAKDGFISAMERLRQPFNVNSLAQAAAIAALDDKEFLNRSRKLILSQKRFLYRALEEMELDYIPSAANFILIDLKKDAKLVFKRMLNYGVIVRDMLPYGLKTCIRVTIGRPEENKRFIEVLEEVI